MCVNKFKIIVLFSILCLFVAIPAGFAMDNDTAIIDEGNFDDDFTDYYFDAGVENDSGNGSVDNPYKELKSARISGNSNIHLANGQYWLDGVSYANNVNILGSDPEKTIINFYGVGFNLRGPLTLNNVTLVNLGIRDDYAHDLVATNTIFKDYSLSNLNVIHSNEANIYFNNCTFINNKASSNGGAICVSGGNMIINNTLFENNIAKQWGGAISCEDGANVVIDNSKFIADYSVNDAGGAIYLLNSTLSANNVEIYNCSATFGGAIASLSSELYLTNFTAKNNRAKYYGGAVFAFYRIFSIYNSTLINNSAEKGGALLVDGVESFEVFNNIFENNSANYSGAIYSVLSDFYYDSLYDDALNNTFINNDASSNSVNMTIGNSDYVMIKLDTSYDGTLPDKYDLRELGQVSSVKDQGNGGNCWAFSVLAALESSIMKALNISVDLSEENMKNIMSRYSDYGWIVENNRGGYVKMAVGYLTSWLGPVNETDDEYNAKSLLSPLLDSWVHVQNIEVFIRKDYNDNDAIKRAIMNYGAVSTSAKWTSSCIKGKTYYYSGSASADHAVVIVGWDDNFSKSNFRTQPEGDGAWIIKNSWGSSGGDNGFYYVSYYDTRFAQPGAYVSYAFILNDTMRYDKNYQYDIQGKTDYFFKDSNVAWYKNKFNATDDEYLSAVSTYFEKDTSWDLSIFVNDELKLTQSGFSSSSYSTINLNELIPLKKGDIFEVMFKIKVSKNVGIPISEDISLNHLTYGENISFVSFDGENWTDFYELEGSFPDHTYYSQVACIKAFTILNKVNTSIILDAADSFNPVEITAHVSNQYGGVVNSGVVTFNVDGKSIDVNVEKGIAKLKYIFKTTGDNNVTATFTGVGYNANSSSISVSANAVYIRADDLTVYCGENSYNATLLDKQDVPVANKEIIFTVDGKRYVVKSGDDGVATISFNLTKAGRYSIRIDLIDDVNIENLTLTKQITAISTITLPTTLKYTLNSKYGVTLLDNQGNPLAGQEISLIANSMTYNLTTDENGFVKFNINMKPGSYVISTVNNITGEVKSQTIKVVARINSNKDITMYYGAGTYYKVRVYDNYGNVAKKVKVTFNINGKNYYRYSDSKGYASLKISVNPKTYTITAKYQGYKVSNKVVVKPTLVLSTKTVKKSKTFKYTVKLLNSKGKILKYKKVTVKFRGKTYTAKTNYKGIATFYVKSLSKTGKYSLTASYGSAKISKTITIKK